MIGKNSKEITDADYTSAKKVCKDFGTKCLSGYYYLYVQSDRLLLAGVFENFLNMCLEICELDLACFLTAPGLVWY